MSEIMKRTQQELMDELSKRFGPVWLDWAFVCPSCGDVATGRDWLIALGSECDDAAAVARLGRECIGRGLGALREKRQEDWKGRGCDWTSYGLFRGPEFVIKPDGTELPAFRIAEASA